MEKRSSSREELNTCSRNWETFIILGRLNFELRIQGAVIKQNSSCTGVIFTLI